MLSIVFFRDSHRLYVGTITENVIAPECRDHAPHCKSSSIQSGNSSPNSRTPKSIRNLSINPLNVKRIKGLVNIIGYWRCVREQVGREYNLGHSGVQLPHNGAPS